MKTKEELLAMTKEELVNQVLNQQFNEHLLKIADEKIGKLERLLNVMSLEYADYFKEAGK